MSGHDGSFDGVSYPGGDAQQAGAGPDALAHTPVAAYGESASPITEAGAAHDQNAATHLPGYVPPPQSTSAYQGASAPGSESGTGFGGYPGVAPPVFPPNSSANYLPPPGYNLAPGSIGRKPGLSTGAKVVFIVVGALFLLIVVGVTALLALKPALSQAKIPNPTPATTPDGLSDLNGMKHFRNKAMGLDLDVPADWTPHSEANTMAYLAAPSGCNLIVMDNTLFAVTPDAYNDALKQQLTKGMPGVTFGTRPAWAGPQPPTSSIEATSGRAVMQYYTHFFRTGHVLSTIETMKSDDEGCTAQFRGFEQSFRLR